MTNFAMPVSQYMSSPVISVSEDTLLREVNRVMRDRRISSVPVVNGEGRCTGVITRTDLLRVGRLESQVTRRTALLTLPDRPVSDVMARNVVVVSRDASVDAAARLMVKRRIHRVIVTSGSALAGIFSTKEVLTAVREKRLDAPITEWMSAPVLTIGVSEPLSVATDRIARAHVAGLVVVDEENWPVGTFTQLECLAARDLPSRTPVEDVMSYAMLCLDVHTPLFRAAAQAHATRARRVLAVERSRVKGILTGMDFARAVS